METSVDPNKRYWLILYWRDVSRNFKMTEESVQGVEVTHEVRPPDYPSGSRDWRTSLHDARHRIRPRWERNGTLSSSLSETPLGGSPTNTEICRAWPFTDRRNTCIGPRRVSPTTVDEREELLKSGVPPNPFLRKRFLSGPIHVQRRFGTRLNITRTDGCKSDFFPPHSGVIPSWVQVGTSTWLGLSQSSWVNLYKRFHKMCNRICQECGWVTSHPH